MNFNRLIERREAVKEQPGVDKLLTSRIFAVKSRVHVCARTSTCGYLREYMHTLEINPCAEHTQLACHSHSFVKLPVSGTVCEVSLLAEDLHWVHVCSKLLYYNHYILATIIKVIAVHTYLHGRFFVLISS